MIREKFQALVSACADDADMLDIIDSDMKALSDYVNAVYAMETSIPIILARYEGEEVRDRIQALDQRRRDKHERAIVATKRLNRFAQMEHVQPLFAGDTSDRYQIAEFCQACMTEFFAGRDGHTLSLDEALHHPVHLEKTAEEAEYER